MRIDVTAADIAAGKHESCSECPVALAVGRALNMPVMTGGSIVRPIDGFYFFADLPSEAKKFIRDYDNRLTVSPFSFEIELEEAAP